MTPAVAVLLASGLLVGSVVLAAPRVAAAPAGDDVPAPGVRRRTAFSPDRLARPRRSVVVVLAVGVLVLVPTGVVSGPAAGHLVLTSLATVGVAHGVHRGGVRRARARAGVAAGRACELLVGELGAGVPSGVALHRVAEHHRALAPVVAAAGVGSDVPSALRALARTTGVPVWSRVADAWQVSERSGAALAPVLARVAQAERDEVARRRLVATELADAVATARLMAVLPVLLVGAASVGGGTAATFLLTTWPGLACATLGLGLIATGLVWIDRISAEDGS